MTRQTLNRLVGLVIELPDRCKRCESIVAVIGNKSHANIVSLVVSVVCQRCGTDRGQLSPSTHSFLTEIINRFGRPTTPIKIRPSASTRDNSETDSECAPGAARREALACQQTSIAVSLPHVRSLETKESEQ